MWTPHRIMLTLVGIFVFVGAYFGYTSLLGNFDGLPPLPEQYKRNTGAARTEERPKSNSTDKKFEMAFGVNCPELRFPIKLEMKQKRILLASYKFEIIKSGPRQGWVEMSPLSLAVMGEKFGPDGLPEINIVYCDLAYLRFDEPVRSMSDFNGRKMAAAELHANPEAPLSDPRKGRVRLINNRKTTNPHDDVEMVTPGPVYYEADPPPNQPNIYTFTAVQITDHQNTELEEPNRDIPRDPTVAGVGLRVFLAKEPKEKEKPPGDPKVVRKKKDDRSGGMNGVESVGLDHSVEMTLWTDSSASSIAPGASTAAKKAGPEPKKAGAEPKKGPAAPTEKRRMTIRTNGPFRYDLTRELAHFEKPPVARPGLVEHVTVTRTGRTTGLDLVDCDYMDVQFQRGKPAVKKDGAPPPPKKEGARDGDLEVKSIRAWGETVVITSDSENLHATGAELIHDADAHMTVLKGGPDQQVQAVKEGNLIRGNEMHLFGDGKEITQAHILGAGSIGMGELDPKTGEYQKQAFWSDRLVYTKQVEKGQLPLDVFTFLGKDGRRAMFRDVSSGELQQVEAQQLKVWLKSPDQDKDKDGKKGPAKKAESKKVEPRAGGGDDMSKSARPTRMEGTGDVRSNTPDLIIKQADYLNVIFKDVPKLMKPKADPKDPKTSAKEGPAAVGPAPRIVPADPRAGPIDLNPKVVPPQTKGPDGKAKDTKDAKDPKDAKLAKDPKKDGAKAKIPFVVVGRSIEAWVNRDPPGQTELDHVHAVGDVEAHQAPANKDEQGTDVIGQTVDVQAHADGDRMVVLGDASDKAKLKWGIVRSDKLTIYGFDIVIDQRTDTSLVTGMGQMEILSATTMEGKKLDNPTTMHIMWKHKMDFLGADKVIYYHGGVQAYQEGSRVKCEWMQVLLDRPVYLDRTRRDKAPPPPPLPGAKPGDVDKNPRVDTIFCYHAPKDEDAPRPKVPQPVTAIEETKENGKLVKFQSIQAPDLVTVNTPLENKRTRHDITATSTDTMPGTVRLWQPGQKDDATGPGQGPKDKGPKDKSPKDGITPVGGPKTGEPKKNPAKKKGELSADEEMKLTVVQFGEKMKAEDLRKRAKFWTNIRVVHLPADRPNLPVDLREGEIPKGAVYLEARDTLEVFNTIQREKDADGEEVDVTYQEMDARGNCRVRKQGEFFGDADRVAYSQLKGTVTFYGTDKNPAVLNQVRGQGIRDKTHSGRTIIYHLATKQVETMGATQLTD